jgi:hypothetical protein
MKDYFSKSQKENAELEDFCNRRIDSSYIFVFDFQCLLTAKEGKIAETQG